MELLPKEARKDIQAIINEAERELPIIEKEAENRWFSLPRFERKLITFLVSFAFVLGLGSYFWFYFLPQKEAEAIAQRLRPLLVETQSNLDNTHREISGLFELVSGEKVPQSQTAGLDLGEVAQNLKGRIAGAQNVSNFYDFLLVARNDLVNASQKVVEIESEGVAEARAIREKAVSSRVAAQRAQDSLSLLLQEATSIFPYPLLEAGKNLDAVFSLSNSYLSEAKRTANFYVTVSEVQVDLVPTTVSLVTLIQEVSSSSAPSIYLGKIRQLSGTVVVFREKISALGEALPVGMDALHEDNLSVFTLLEGLLMEAAQAAAQNDPARLDIAVTQFEVELEVLATRAKTYELNFWQKTAVLKGYPEISAGYQTSLDELGSFVQ
ncbi:hypothetical protein A2797_02360 [candidate division WWE3 bacterium RIFCSPHIGHO2_01_FULL_48_15]|uniref:Uncharacterized protein n=1 Tax=candidate division WWE3 bacterium RIFCSPHIGHO2_01_FULL_48_15 TaxID=1802619 RepID=A0A1F4VC04_UNCKA|nr:MAG: hypothetical protein A2797_02360 [candidate division WWE3 bacterium RIFCSPHIGHO2_01_FULL_48_15]